MNYISYIRLYKNKNRILRKFFFFLVFYNGLYRKTFMPLKKLHIFFNNKLLLRHGMIKFIFGPQQVFFQLFTRNAKTPDTHTTVGTLIRIRENIKEHAGKYVFRNEDKADISARERRRDKKFSMYFRKQRSTENFRNLIVKKKLVQPRLIEDKEQTLQRIKTELLLKHVRKKNKNAEIVIVRNKRGNPKTEPLFGKAQRRRFYMWLWFIKCILLFLQNKYIKLYKGLILSIVGLIKIHKKILKYILSTFHKANIMIFLLKLNLKYRGAKLKHFTTIKKKTKKRLIKMEHNEFFR